MIKIKLLFLFVLVFTTILFSHQNNTLNLSFEEQEFIKNNPIIKVGAEKEYPPFYFNEDGKQTGLIKDYLDLIEEKTSFKFNYISDSWENILQGTKEGTIDLIPLAAKTTKRETFLNFSNKHIKLSDYIFSKHKTIIENLENLDGKTIAIIRGYALNEFMKVKYPNVKILLVDSILESIDAIYTNKADFLISNLAIINYLTKKNHLEKLATKLFVDHNATNLYMATNINNKILFNIIEKALNSIKDIEKDEILKKWIVDVNKNRTNIFNTEELNFISNNKTLTIANELDYKPYDYNDKGIAKGYIIDYMKLLFTKIGIEPIFKAARWTKLIADFKNKEIDLLPIITKNKKREEYISFTKSHIKQDLRIITKINNNSIINMDDLNGKTVGLGKDWNMTKFVKKYYPKIKIVEYKKVSEFLDAVKNNYVHATILDNLSANYFIKTQYPNKLHITGQALIKNFNSDLYIGVDKEKSILRNILNKSMSLISKEEQDLLNDKWINISPKINLTNEEKIFIKNKIINIAFPKNWAPFSFIDNNKPYGLGYDFWKLISDKIGIKSRIIQKDTFTKALEMIKNKESDIIITTTKTKDKENYSIFTNEYFTSPIGIATLKEENYIQNAKQLIGKRVAVGRNYSAYKLVKESYPNIDFVLVTGINEALELLSNNEVYAVIDNMPVLIHNIQAKGYGNIKITGTTGIDFKMNIMIRDDYKVLKTIINKVLKNITPHEKETIYNKWFNLKYEEAFDYSLFWKVIAAFLFIFGIILYKNRKLLISQKKLETTTKELELSVENFKTLIDINIAGIVLIKDKKIVYMNKEFINIFLYNNYDDLINKDISEVFTRDSLTNIFQTTNTLDEAINVEGIKKDFTKIPLLIKKKNIIFNNLPCDIISIIDLTDIKSQEKLLIQQSKMASLGEMIANIAHQWRQPLSLISTTASGIKIQKEFGILDDKMFVDNIDSITETTQFLSQTIDDFQNYIKNDKLKKEFEIKSSVNRVLNIMKGALSNHFIKVEKHIANIKISSYENELNQALLNIITNSKDALKDIDEKDRMLYINVYQSNNDAIIEIIDTAGGIPIDIINKVFEPYFTTKHQSQGTGLGLYMTHKIITESMGGYIKIDNITYLNHNKCTKVTISIPIS
jgi:ABC-type amino acid transport substrate-binding protein/signal transduction histidine kinase